MLRRRRNDPILIAAVFVWLLMVFGAIVRSVNGNGDIMLVLWLLLLGLAAAYVLVRTA